MESDLISAYREIVVNSMYSSEGDKIKSSGWHRILEMFSEKWPCNDYVVLMVTSCLCIKQILIKHALSVKIRENENIVERIPLPLRPAWTVKLGP
jgi:hypothetical protein